MVETICMVTEENTQFNVTIEKKDPTVLTRISEKILVYVFFFDDVQLA